MHHVFMGHRAVLLGLESDSDIFLMLFLGFDLDMVFIEFNDVSLSDLMDESLE